MSTMTESFNQLMTNVKTWWQEFDLRGLSTKIGGSSAEAVQAAICFGVAFVSGIFLKKYFKFLLAVAVVLAIALKFLEYNSCITINWEMIKTSLGIVEPFDFNYMIKIAFVWVKQNILLTVAISIGFLVGYKLG